MNKINPTQTPPPFPDSAKSPRLFRQMTITEKIDGCQMKVCILEDGSIFVGSKNKWLSFHDDFKGFFKWAMLFREELLTLGPGVHAGEWWGSGIGRGYGLTKGEKRFSLFNTGRWCDHHSIPAEGQRQVPECMSVVPVLYTGDFDTKAAKEVLQSLADIGSVAVPGFMRPEGIMVFQHAANVTFKATLDNEDKGKWETVNDNSADKQELPA